MAKLPIIVCVLSKIISAKNGHFLDYSDKMPSVIYLTYSLELLKNTFVDYVVVLVRFDFLIYE